VARGISPPDLSQCTRIEVEYDPSTLEHFFPNYERHSVLSPEEIAYVRSLKTVIEDPKIIKAIAREVCAGQHISIRKGAITFKAFTRFVCYHEGGDSTLLTILPDTIGIAGHWFKYEDGLRSTRYVPPQIKSLLARERCADNMVHLYDYLRLRYWDGRPFPSPGEWCDVIVEARQAEGASGEALTRSFRCPCAGPGRCHYAINPDCEPNSPADTVLLFEARGGWNQHGGRELFTFDHHEPRGGLVLLNGDDWDGMNRPTVKFIRTEEELRALRWK